MRFMKFFSIMLVAFALVVMTACGGAGTGANKDAGSGPTATPANTPEKTPPKEGDKLLFVGWSGEQEIPGPVIKNMIQAWNDKNAPDSFSWMGWPWGNTLEQLLIRNKGKEPMDVAQVDIGWIRTLIGAGVLTDLSTVFDKAWLTENYSEAYLKMGQVDGKQYALPWTVAATSMVVNPSLLQSAGVASYPTTIKEFEDALQKLKAAHPDVIPYAFDTKDEEMSTDFQVWLKVFGGGVVDESGKIIINNEGSVAAVAWMKSLLDKGYIKMDIAKYDARQLFIQQKTAIIDDAYLIKGQVKNSGVAAADLAKRVIPVPRPVVKSGDPQVSKLWGHMLVIPNLAKDPKKSAELIKLVVGTEWSINYFKTVGQLPVLKEAIAKEEVQSDEVSKEWLKLTEFSGPSDTEKYSQKKSLDKIINEEVQAALLGKKTPQKAMDDAASRLQAALK